MLSVDAVHVRLTWVVDMGVAVRLAGAVGGVVSEMIFETVTVLDADVVTLPAASLAVAVMTWEALVAVVVFQTMEYGEVVSSDIRLFPSSLNWTPATPMLSEAVAETVVVVPETVALAAGAVREMVGGVVSGTTQYEGLFMLTVIPAEVVWFPAASKALAVKLWVWAPMQGWVPPLVVSHAKEYGDEVSDPFRAPST